MKSLTNSFKNEIFPKLIQEFGFVCVLCEKPIEKGENWDFCHLNDKSRDNRIENIGISHHSCNVRMINDIDMKLKAQELLRQREEAGLKFQENPTTLDEISSERKANKILFPFTKQYLTEQINTDSKILLADALAEICYLTQEKYGIGAEPTIRRYIKQLTCGVAPFQIITDDKGKDWIVRRVLN